MKAIILHPGTTNVELKDWPEPFIQNPDEIKAKVMFVGICGTDREETTGGRADAPAEEKELIIGHEMIGQIIEIGKDVKTVKPGDCVVFTVRRGCGACIPCNNFRSDMCLTGNYTERGIKGRHGFQSQFVVEKECYAIKVPNSIKDIGVLAEPMSVVEKAIDEAGLIQKARYVSLANNPNWLEGKTAVIAGLGPIGLLAGVILALRGAKIIGLDIVDPNSSRAQLFKQLGGIYVNDKTMNLENFKKDYPNVDVIVDAAGIAKLDFDLLDLLGINGVFVLTGVPGDQRLVDIDGAHLMRQLVLKNQVMVGSVNASIEHFRTGIADLEAASKKWPGLMEKFISQRYPYQQYDEALHHHTPDETKVVIAWN